MDDYRRSSHSKHSLKVHLIFVCKYRKKLLIGGMVDDVKQIIYDISKKKNYSVITMENDKDHIHLLLQYNPNDSISEIVKLLKQVTTYYLWKKYPIELKKKQFWKENTFWSDGYFACSIGQVSQATIEKYIQNQG